MSTDQKMPTAQTRSIRHGRHNSSPHREGPHRLGPRRRKLIARLVQLHREFHPRRLESLLGLSIGYAERIWSQTPSEEQGDITEALAFLREIKCGAPPSIVNSSEPSQAA